MATLGLVFIEIIAWIYSGFALSVLWGWFISSQFNLPELSIPTAIGVALTIGFISTDTSTSDIKFALKHPDEHLGLSLFSNFLLPTLVLIIGFIVSFFV